MGKEAFAKVTAAEGIEVATMVAWVEFVAGIVAFEAAASMGFEEVVGTRGMERGAFAVVVAAVGMVKVASAIAVAVGGMVKAASATVVVD